MKRGDVYDARLDPIEGSEQGGIRPVIIVSRDAINASSTLVIAVPCTTYRSQRQLYPQPNFNYSPRWGLSRDSVGLGEQVRAVSKSRLLRLRGTLSQAAIAQLNKALLMAMDLPGQFDDEIDI